MLNFENISEDALITAAVFGYKDAVAYLYETGVELAGYYNQIARRAAASGQLDTIEYMYNNHMFEAAGYSAYGAAMQAAINGQLDVLEFLYNCGIKIILNKDDIMIETATKGYVDTLQYLHEQQGFNIHLANNNMMQNAISNGQLEVIKYLQSQNVGFENCDKAILFAFSKDCMKTIEYLQSKGLYTDGEFVTDVFAELRIRNPVLNDAKLFMFQDNVMIEIENEDRDIECYQILQVNTEYPRDVETGLNVNNMMKLFGCCYEYVTEQKNIETEIELE